MNGLGDDPGGTPGLLTFGAADVRRLVPLDGNRELGEGTRDAKSKLFFARGPVPGLVDRAQPGFPGTYPVRSLRTPDPRK